MALQLPTTQRDQLLAFGCVVAIAAIGLYYQFVWTPKGNELLLVQTRIDSLSVQNDAARREIARGTASKLKGEAEQYGRMLALMRTLVPVANEVPALIDQISTAARKTGLDISDLTPLGVISGDVFDTYRYKLTVTGPYHRLARFLTNVGSLDRIVAPMNLALVQTVRDIKALRPQPGEQMLDANFEIQTYVAKTSGRAP